MYANVLQMHLNSIGVFCIYTGGEAYNIGKARVIRVPSQTAAVTSVSYLYAIH